MRLSTVDPGRDPNRTPVGQRIRDVEHRLRRPSRTPPRVSGPRRTPVSPGRVRTEGVRGADEQGRVPSKRPLEQFRPPEPREPSGPQETDPGRGSINITI